MILGMKGRVDKMRISERKVFKKIIRGNGSSTIVGVKEVLAEMKTEKMAPMTTAR